MKRARQAVQIISGVVFGLLLTLVVLSSIGVALPMVSGSMHTAGHVIFILPSEEYKVGDVVTFRTPDPNAPPITTHRVVEVTTEGLITKGDARNAPDDWAVPLQDVLGKQRFTIPYLAELLVRLGRIIGLLILTAVIFTACLWSGSKTPI
jgi:signal peptidase I